MELQKPLTFTGNTETGFLHYGFMRAEGNKEPGVYDFGYGEVMVILK